MILENRFSLWENGCDKYYNEDVEKLGQTLYHHGHEANGPWDYYQNIKKNSQGSRQTKDLSVVSSSFARRELCL
jgi:hypothetical protein